MVILAECAWISQVTRNILSCMQHRRRRGSDMACFRKNRASAKGCLSLPICSPSEYSCFIAISFLHSPHAYWFCLPLTPLPEVRVWIVTTLSWFRFCWSLHDSLPLSGLSSVSFGTADCSAVRDPSLQSYTQLLYRTLTSRIFRFLGTHACRFQPIAIYHFPPMSWMREKWSDRRHLWLPPKEENAYRRIWSGEIQSIVSRCSQLNNAPPPYTWHWLPSILQGYRLISYSIQSNRYILFFLFRTIRLPGTI